MTDRKIKENDEKSWADDEASLEMAYDEASPGPKKQEKLTEFDEDEWGITFEVKQILRIR